MKNIKTYNHFLNENKEYEKDDLSFLINQPLNLIQTVRKGIYLGSMSRRDKFDGNDVEIHGTITSIDEYKGGKSKGIWVNYNDSDGIERELFLKYDKYEDLFFNGDSYVGNGATDTFVGLTEKDNEILNLLKNHTKK